MKLENCKVWIEKPLAEDLGLDVSKLDLENEGTAIFVTDGEIKGAWCGNNKVLESWDLNLNVEELKEHVMRYELNVEQDEDIL